jgi:hypothetical protein
MYALDWQREAAGVKTILLSSRGVQLCVLSVHLRVRFVRGSGCACDGEVLWAVCTSACRMLCIFLHGVCLVWLLMVR